jgi:hypothetical protein
VSDFFNRGTLAGLAPSTIFAGGGMDTRAWALSARRGG